MSVCTEGKEGSICDLGDDLVMNILSRLPSKPLVICKCVSKSWLHLVSTIIHSPTRPRPVTGFVVDGVDLYRGNLEIKCCLKGEIEVEIISNSSLTFLPCHPETRIMACRDGFLVCAFNDMGRDGVDYYICNPLTRQWVALPQPPRYKGVGKFHQIENVAVFLIKSPDVYSAHFKALRFTTFYDDHLPVAANFRVLVDEYSSQSGRWTELKAFSIGTELFFCKESSVFVDGAVFLLASPCLTKYDVEEELFTELELPSQRPGSNPSCLGKSEGRLSFACHSDLGVEVWMMEGAVWVLKHRITLGGIGFPEPQLGSDDEQLEMIAFHPNLDAVFIRKKNEIFCYDFSSRALEKILCFHVFPFVWLMRVHPFSESLLPLEGAQQWT